VFLAPLHERPDAVVADVAVGAAELGGAGDPEAVRAEPAGDDLRPVVASAFMICAISKSRCWENRIRMSRASSESPAS
jgi:hypothetical protein